MDHDFTGPSWAAHHRETSRAIGAMIDKLAYAFERLQAQRYDAPWHRGPQHRAEGAAPHSTR